jgi:septal ring factor EnvC (AmiA/AmiB activator)
MRSVRGESSMRALLSNTTPGGLRARLLLAATLLLAGLCALALTATGAPAETPQEELEQTRDKLEDVRGEQSAVAASLAEQNRAIDAMIGEVSALRQQQAAVEAELAAKQAELERATAELEAERRHLEKVKAKLKEALSTLRERLVAIYEAGSPDLADAILEAEDWSEIAAQTEYLNQIQSYDDSVVDRVKSLRDEVKGAVAGLTEARDTIETARDEIAQKEREVAAARAEAESRFAELKAAQAERRRTLDSLESREQALSSNLASISNQIASEGGPAPIAETPAPLTPGERAQLLNESEASAPAAAPDAVKAVIAAANAIAHTPYLWGGGHGSFESSGYDCSGALSYALHGGGFLDSPLDSTGLETWGEPGAGKWITVYANAGHTWMIVAGIAFDTVGGPGPRWHDPPASSTSGFIVRHPAGY